MLPEILVAGTALNLLLLCTLLVMNRNRIADPFRNVKKEVWALLIIILLAGIALRLSSPAQYLFIDENYRLSAASNLILEGKAEICHYSCYEEELCRPYFKPFGSVIIFSAAFLISGISIGTAICTSLLFGSLCIIVAFALVRALFNDSRPALYASGLLAAYPPLVALSATSEDFMIALFFGLLSLFCLSLYMKNDDQKTLYLFLFSLAFALNTRIELLVLVPAAILMLSPGGLLKRFRDYRFRIALIISSSFFIIYAQRLWAEISAESLQFFSRPLFIDHIQEALRHTVSEYADILSFPAEALTRTVLGFYYPFLFNIIVVAGIALAMRRKAGFPWSMGLIFLLLVGLYAASGFVQPVLIIFAVAFGFFPLSSAITTIQDSLNIRSILLSVPILLLLMLSFIPSSYTGSGYTDNLLSHKNYMHFNTEQRTLETIAVDSMGHSLPENSYVVSMSYNALSAMPNLNAVPLYTALSSGTVESVLGNGSSVFFYDGYICTNGFYNPTCSEFSRLYLMQEVSSYSLGNTTYALYSVTGAREGIEPEPERIFPYPLWHWE